MCPKCAREVRVSGFRCDDQVPSRPQDPEVDSLFTSGGLAAPASGDEPVATTTAQAIPVRHGRLPRVDPLGALLPGRDEKIGPPPVNAVVFHREKPASVTLPTCRGLSVAPSERIETSPPLIERKPEVATADGRRIRPALLAACIGAATVAAIPILSFGRLPAALREVASAPAQLFEGRSAFGGRATPRAVSVVPSFDGVPTIAANPKPYKWAVPPGPKRP